MAGAAGHPGPYRMQHLLSRARFDEQLMLETAADWTAGHLAEHRPAAAATRC